jgi:hypothetical protein
MMKTDPLPKVSHFATLWAKCTISALYLFQRFLLLAFQLWHVTINPWASYLPPDNERSTTSPPSLHPFKMKCLLIKWQHHPLQCHSVRTGHICSVPDKGVQNDCWWLWLSCWDPSPVLFGTLN